jgi:hypothetical protein
MSAVTSRPRVSGIVLTAAAGSLVAGAALTAGLLRTAGAAVRALHRELQANRPARSGEILPLATVRQASAALPAARAHEVRALPALDAVKLDTAVRLSSLVAADAAPLAAPLRALEAASTLEQAHTAARSLMVAAQAEHHRVFTSTLVAACSRASLAVGFRHVETSTAADGTLRVVATSDAGHALVTEIQAAPDAEPRMASEVIGLHDGSCNAILDRFDQALEAEGVRSAPPRRSFTGGVCELSAAREFVRRTVRPKSKPASQSKTTTEAPARTVRRSAPPVRKQQQR